MGVWVEQFNRWRYVPGRLGFYGTFGRFEDWAEDEHGAKIRITATPKIRDLEWHRTYYTLETDGFSGWSNDPMYTSDRELLNPFLKKTRLSDARRAYLCLPDGRFKEYIPARENLIMLHEEPKGYPLYHNEAQNHIELGTRGGGKSYYKALGEALYDLVFDNMKYYIPGKPFTKSTAILEITAGNESKSAELIDKIVFGMDQLEIDPTLGAFGEKGNVDFEPCPFWKRMTGSTAANNQKDPWIHEYPVQVGTEWKKAGSRSRLYHTVYADNSKVRGQKSAGGRRTRVIHEEIGINRHFTDAWGTNEGMITADGVKNASQNGIGTSGNIELILPSKRVFTNPKDYRCLGFTRDGEDKEYGFFIPEFMVNMKFKDENGNTDIVAAREYSDMLYLEKSKANNPEVLIHHRMNYPREIEDMFLSYKGLYLPVQEAEARERELVKGDLWKSLATPVKLSFDPTFPEGIRYEVDLNANPITQHPFEPDRKEFDGAIMMYIKPDSLRLGAVIPNDAVFITHDPYISDNIEEGGSIGVTHVVVNPKYSVFGLPGNQIAATYIAKPRGGVKVYNENLEKLCAFYGNPVRGLWYEANRGDKVRSHFMSKNKLSLLCLRPQYTKGQFLYERKPTETGYVVANNVDKKALLDSFSDWLLEENQAHRLTVGDSAQVRLNIQLIPCLYTIQQIRQFQFDANLDAVSSMLGLPLALGERQAVEELRQNKKENPFGRMNRVLKSQL